MRAISFAAYQRDPFNESSVNRSFLKFAPTCSPLRIAGEPCGWQPVLFPQTMIPHNGVISYVSHDAKERGSLFIPYPGEARTYLHMSPRSQSSLFST